MNVTEDRQRRRRGLLGALVALVLAGCAAGGSSPTPTPSSPASASPTEAASPSSSVEPADSPTPSPSPAVTPSPPPAPTDAAGCPILPTDLAAIRDTAKAGRAIACFGHRSLTFRAFVPTIEDLGGVSGYRQTPTWIADPWTGVILQPAPLPDVDQTAWLVVRVAPALGTCSITAIRDAACPFGAHLDGYVTLTGHFDDAAAQQCRSRAFVAGQPSGPTKTAMIARCRNEFVVTAIAAG